MGMDKEKRMKKAITAALLIVSLSAGVGSASSGYCPGHKVVATPISTSSGYCPGHHLSARPTSFVEQVRSFWNHLFAWV